MRVKAELWMQYWCQPHAMQYQGKNRDAVEGFLIWLILHPSTVVTEIDMLDDIKEAFPHLEPLLDGFESVQLHRMAIDIETIIQELTDDPRTLEVARHIMDHHLEKATTEGLYVINEFMCGRAKDGSLLSSDRDPATHRMIMDAYDHVARLKGHSILLNSDNEITSVSLSPDGTPKIDKVMGQAMIDRKVDEFRSAMESWMPKGGEQQ